MTNSYHSIAVSHEAALAIVERAVHEGRTLGVAISACVVDASINLVACVKADGATPHSIESSRRKANAAASTRRPTGWMDETLALALPLATNLNLTNLAGGVPLDIDGTVAGGLGVAGGTLDQDRHVAEAAAAFVLGLQHA